MKYINRLLLGILLLSCSVGLNAQQERWETYVIQKENGPAGITARMDLKQYSPVPEYPELLKVTYFYKERREDGFPSSEEFDQLSGITTELLVLMNESAENIYAGSFTYDGQSTDYFYLQKIDEIEQLVSDMFKEKFPKRKFEIDTQADPKWTIFEEKLYPTEQIQHFLSDQKVIQNLVDDGDDIKQPRKVSHWIYFKTEDELHAFGDAIQTYNFQVESIDDYNNRDWPIQLVIYRSDPVDMISISEVTTALRNLAKDHGGIYDGWGTSPIVK